MKKDPQVTEYLQQVSEDRREKLRELRKTLLQNLPEGFTESMEYGMPAYSIPHSIYPAGYHCDKSKPLPFINFASQKSHIALYHHGVYADPKLHDWFVAEYPKYSKTKLNMGKSCIRFKKPEHIPMELLAVLFQKMSAQQWIELYEEKIKR